MVVGTVTDTGYTLTFSGAHQGVTSPVHRHERDRRNRRHGGRDAKGTKGLLPIGATATIAAWGGAGALNDAGFQVTFGGNLGLVNVSALALTNMTGLTGFVGETARGGPIDNQGFTVTNTGSAPVVTAPAGYTIPTRTPFALTGSATDRGRRHADLHVGAERPRRCGGNGARQPEQGRRPDLPPVRHGARHLGLQPPALQLAGGEPPPRRTRRASSPTCRRSWPTTRTPRPATAPALPRLLAAVRRNQRPAAAHRLLLEFLPTSKWVGFTATGRCTSG